MMVDANMIEIGDEVKGTQGHTVIKVQNIKVENDRYHFIAEDGHYLAVSKDKTVYRVE